VQGANATEGPRRLAAIPLPGDLTRLSEPFGALPRKCYYYIIICPSIRAGLGPGQCSHLFWRILAETFTYASAQQPMVGAGT
jgi:hypothetical protein